MKLKWTFFWVVSALSSSAWAGGVLPYANRTHSYSGYNSNVRGDNTVVGMAGAVVAIPGSISALEANPAGLTMTMGSVSAQISSNEMRDRTLTGDEGKVKAQQWGLAVVPGKWGFAFARYTPYFESGRFQNPNTNSTNSYDLAVNQYHLTASRASLSRKLSIGGSLIINRAVRSLGKTEYGRNELSYRIGAIYHVQDHFLIGASYSPAMDIKGVGADSGSPELPGFAQAVNVPALLTVGGGWIPNRFFSAGIAVTSVGRTSGAALLRDDSVMVGSSRTLQPKIGATYTIGQYENLKISTAAGAYYENVRIAGIKNRTHGTFSLSVNPYFVNTGIGFDRARAYNNFNIFLGVDVVRLLRTFDIIPPDTIPPYRGMWPHPIKVQADGLPPSLTSGEKSQYAAPTAGDVGEIISDIPQNVINKIEGEPAEHEKKEQLKIDEAAAATAKKKPRRRRTPKRTRRTTN